MYNNADKKYFVLILLYDFRCLDVLSLYVPYLTGLRSPSQLLDSASDEHL